MTVFHVKPYYEGNSLRGIDRAAAARNKDGTRRWDEIDLDMLITKDGHIVGTHWPRPMLHGFRDPQRKLRRTRTVASMTLDEVHRLRAGGDANYVIQPIENLLSRCAERGIGARLEPKVRAFYQPVWWKYLARSARDLGASVKMYALRRHDGDRAFGEKCVRAAASAGIKGRVIH